jgi:hypothetical protein
MAALFDAEMADAASADSEWTEKFLDGLGNGNSITISDKQGTGVWCYSGHGDGSYCSYWGLDESNNVVCLVVDFSVLAEGVYESRELTHLENRLNRDLTDTWFRERGCTNVTIRRGSRDELRMEYRSLHNALKVEFFLDGEAKPPDSSGYSGDLHYSTITVPERGLSQVRIVASRFVGMRAFERISPQS